MCEQYGRSARPRTGGPGAECASADPGDDQSRVDRSCSVNAHYCLRPQGRAADRTPFIRYVVGHHGSCPRPAIRSKHSSGVHRASRGARRIGAVRPFPPPGAPEFRCGPESSVNRRFCSLECRAVSSPGPQARAGDARRAIDPPGAAGPRRDGARHLGDLDLSADGADVGLDDADVPAPRWRERRLHVPGDGRHGALRRCHAAGSADAALQ